jgi:uncharacterized protein
MVSRGQYLERPALIPVGEHVLEGLWHRGDRRPPLLVLAPPPDAGSMDHVVCAELAWAAARAGHPVLRFNYRGVGASQGSRGDGAARLADAEAALRLLRENTGAFEVVVASVGASAETAARLVGEHPGIAAVALVSPPGRVLDRPPGVPLLVILGEEEPDQAGRVAAAQELGGQVEVLGGADSRFQRALPEVGRLAVRWLQAAGKGPDS